jgi:SAM-dependent methyltransferase
VSTPEFPRRDPADAEFWDLRYRARYSPWDAGKVPLQLRRFADGFGGERRVLVPGCGSGHDVRFLAETGWDALGIDFSAAALDAARPVLGPHEQRLRQADFFADLGVPAFPFVYERAFLCALPRRLWSEWGARMAELVAGGGALAGYFFFDEGTRGPPFPLNSQAELDALLAGAFERVDDQPVADSIAVFAGKERWQVWRRL